MYNNLLKTNREVFFFLVDQKNLFYYKAQEAEDLGNHEGAELLYLMAADMDRLTKSLAERI